MFMCYKMFFFALETFRFFILLFMSTHIFNLETSLYINKYTCVNGLEHTGIIIIILVFMATIYLNIHYNFFQKLQYSLHKFHKC